MKERNNKTSLTYNGMQIGQYRVIFKNWCVISPNIYFTSLTLAMTAVPALCQPLIINKIFIDYLEYISLTNNLVDVE